MGRHILQSIKGKSSNIISLSVLCFYKYVVSISSSFNGAELLSRDRFCFVRWIRLSSQYGALFSFRLTHIWTIERSLLCSSQKVHSSLYCWRWHRIFFSTIVVCIWRDCYLTGQYIHSHIVTLLISEDHAEVNTSTLPDHLMLQARASVRHYFRGMIYLTAQIIHRILDPSISCMIHWDINFM